MELKQHCEGECLSTSPSAMRNNKFLAANDTNLDSQSGILIITKLKKEDTKCTKLDIDDSLCPLCPLFSIL